MNVSTDKEQPERSSEDDAKSAETVFLPPSPTDSRYDSHTIPPPNVTSFDGDRAIPQIPGYEIYEELGRGGMGVIYKARQIRLKRIVALKMILAGARAGADELARFRREAEAAAQLHDAHIVQVYEVGEHEGCPYLAMEFVDGGTLANRLKGQPQPAHWSAKLVETLARAVQAAHQHGIIHRDLKPANVLLTAEGQVKIADFGLAKRITGETDQTQTGAILGTPSYMAPEQAVGNSKTIGPSTDVYSLGAILYELLTGRPPFRTETPLETLLQVANREPTRPRTVNPSIPRDLETICLHAMSKEVTQRYNSATALADDLHRVLHGLPIHARRVSRTERVWRWCRRNPGIAVMGAVSIVLCIALIGALATRGGTVAADDSLSRVLRRGKLVIATDPTYPPLEFRVDGQLTGFDIDIGRELARRLGVTAEFVPTDWDWHQLTQRLNAHDFDVVMSAITMTGEREQQVNFVEYARFPMVGICRRNLTIREESHLAGKIVAVQTDTTAHRLVIALKRKGIDIKQIAIFPSSVEPIEAVTNGQADVTFAHEPVARHFIKAHGELVVTGPIGNVVESIGIALSKTDGKLQAAIANAIAAMKSDGTIQRSMDRWCGR